MMADRVGIGEGDGGKEMCAIGTPNDGGGGGRDDMFPAVAEGGLLELWCEEGWPGACSAGMPPYPGSPNGEDARGDGWPSRAETRSDKSPI